MHLMCIIKVTTVKNADDFSLHKGSYSYYMQSPKLMLFTGQQNALHVQQYAIIKAPLRLEQHRTVKKSSLYVASAIIELR